MNNLNEEEIIRQAEMLVSDETIWTAEAEAKKEVGKLLTMGQGDTNKITT